MDAKNNVLKSDGSFDFDKAYELLIEAYGDTKNVRRTLDFAKSWGKEDGDFKGAILDAGVALALDGGPRQVLDDIATQLLDTPNTQMHDVT